MEMQTATRSGIKKKKDFVALSGSEISQYILVLLALAFVALSGTEISQYFLVLSC